MLKNYSIGKQCYSKKYFLMSQRLEAKESNMMRNEYAVNDKLEPLGRINDTIQRRGAPQSWNYSGAE
jgi:hypothetical protein